MKKFLLGLLTGAALTVLTAILLVASLARFGVEARPQVPDNAALVLRLEGDIPERTPLDLPFPLLAEQQPASVSEIWEALHRAATDSRIEAILLEPRGLEIGWAKMQELRAGLAAFRKSGKPVIAYLRNPGTREYYLASAADKVYISPEDYLNVKGLLAQSMYFKNTLDKLGVEVQIVHAGKYKDFGDMFVRDRMSPETREALTAILDDLYGDLIRTLAEARGQEVDAMRALLDQGPFLATEAKQNGLIDDLLYEDQVLDELKKRVQSQEVRRVSHRDYIKAAPSSGARVALLVGQGGISAGGDGMGDDDGIQSLSFIRTVRRLAKDDSVRGVILRLDSPGGDAIASDEIWRELNLLSKKKPMVVSMSDTAASGGYYMAMTGDPVLAYPGTVTGSIGVVFGKANLKGLYTKLGVTKDTLKRGRFADIDSDYSALDPEALAKLRRGVDSTYETFVTKVAEARKREFSDVEPLAQGRVWLGSQAHERGLVDELGGLDRAVELIRERAGVEAEEKIRLVTYPPRKTMFEWLFGQTPEVSIPQALTRAAMPEPAREFLASWQARLVARGGYLRLMPFTLEFR
ncbi:MAG: signal peptide peptidase SppA [Bryobacterales bacterium]|nr:signal peptide peptidase SppA [Bryobacterales bacterium]